MSKKKKKKKVELTEIEIFDIKIDNLLNILIPAIIVIIPIIFILYLLNVHGYFYSALGSNIIFRLDKYYRLLLYVLFFIFNYKLFRRQVKITKTDIFLFLLILITIISTIFSKNISIALFGYNRRYEGLFTLLFYYYLYLDIKLLKHFDIKSLIKILLFISIFESIIGITQKLGLFSLIFNQYNVTTAQVIGLTENSDFYGSFTCLFSMFGIVGYLLHKEKNNYIPYLIVFILSYINMLWSNTSSPFISLIFSFIMLIIYLIITKHINIKKLIITIILLITLYPLCLYNNDKITKELNNNVESISNLINNADEVSSTNKKLRKLGHGRLRIWINTINSCKSRWYIGYGPDNLGLVYQKTEDDSKLADKAHNIYLHLWSSSGIFALLSYLIWVIYCGIKGLKSKNVYAIILSFSIFAYSVQGFFNINVSEVTPFFYIIMGIMMYIVNEDKITLKRLN